MPELYIKRFHTSAVADIECPVCKHFFSIDFDHDYLSYPLYNECDHMCWSCPECEEEFNIHFKLSIDLEILGTERVDQ
jgi:hypothetical protein